ncbi:MAG: transglycosylase SLT domain-containing protein [Proteobacteria bacterium]|nr:transglycosylase SLT domain-containing protein [Pseudomonadota bacterium]
MSTPALRGFWVEVGELVVLGFLALLFGAMFGALLGAGVAHAESIPAAALRYRSEVIRAARVEAGLGAPVAVFAAQVEQESGWNPEAVSPVGARGLGQFMPLTARDMGRSRPDLGPASPTNPGWAIRALCAYDLANLKRIRAATPPATQCDAWALTLMAYNGGLGWVWRDQAKAKAQGLDPGLWQSVASVNAGRSIAAKRENAHYAPAILFKRQPKYLAWGPGILCEVAR